VSTEEKKRVVVIGAGFGGLWAVRTLSGNSCDILAIDKNNYHTFLALLYQVAAAELEAEDIAYPVRSIFRNLPDVDFAMGHVRLIDFKNHLIETDHQSFPYDYLILAAGSVPHSFGIPGVEAHAYFLKTLEEGVNLKNHIICCFEKAAQQSTKSESAGILTFIIVGGGATGVEYAGALSEMIRGPIVRDYPIINFSSVRIILVEGTESLLGSMPEPIRSYTRDKLLKMGVEVRLAASVEEVTPDGIILNGKEMISTKTVVWTAGVRGEPLATLSGLPVGRDGRVSVLPTLQIASCPEIYVVGDLARIDADGHPLPMVAQVAMQSGVAAAKNIVRCMAGLPPLPFRYHDRGSMIAIGRNSAGVALGSRTYTGFFAWILWLVIHLFNLIGFRNRVMVLINWAWDYLLYERAVRFVFPSETPSCGEKKK
jgi:NADH dehydrogenase